MRAETRAVAERYGRRKMEYSHFDPAVYCARQELERALIRWYGAANLPGPRDLTLLEIGCGHGGNLLQFLRLGFQPENLVGNELLPDRLAAARGSLPSALRLVEGDACDIDIADESFDVVFQSLVFTSLFDNDYQESLARNMWRLVKPGGGVLWYDFTYDNPANPDVRGVPATRVRELFPDATPHFRRLTLAPPISRRITRIHPALYGWFNLFPFLRTHMLVWLPKPAETSPERPRK